MKTPLHRHAARGAAALRRAGFTLIEILAVILIIGVLATFVVPQVVSAIGSSKSTACQANLGAISRGMLEYQTEHSSLPKGSGVGFFTDLITRKVWQPTVKNSKTLTCPAVALDSLQPGMEEIPVEDWYVPANRELIDGGWSSYAGRDKQRHPVRRLGSGKKALVADDNDPEGNHETTTNVLWDDLSVRALELVDLQDQGLLAAEEDVTFIPVGPDSPVPALQVLSLDK